MSRKRRGFKTCNAQVGVLIPRPSGRAERQATHSSTSGPDGCKQAVFEGQPSAEHPSCVVWDSAETHKRPRPTVAFFSRQGEESERSGITLSDIRGWSTQSGSKGVGSHCPLGKGDAGARHRAERNSVTTECPQPQKDCQTYAPHESVHVPLRCSTGTPHRLRTRMCHRTTHSRGFTHSLPRSLPPHTQFAPAHTHQPLQPTHALPSLLPHTHTQRLKCDTQVRTEGARTVSHGSLCVCRTQPAFKNKSTDSV